MRLGDTCRKPDFQVSQYFWAVYSLVCQQLQEKTETDDTW